MEWVDTHAHVFVEEFAGDRAEIMQRARSAGVSRIFMPNLDAASVEDMLAVEAAFPELAVPLLGLHPCYVKADFRKELEHLEAWLSRHLFAGIGEIGMDYHWDTSFVTEQLAALKIQIGWAKSLDIPVVLHTREATQACIDVVRQEQDGRLRGIFHCFSGSLKDAEQIRDLGFHLGIGGVLTFKNSSLADLLSTQPLSSVVLETDAPYLAPVPYRGKRNESAYIPLIANKLAEIKQVSLQEVSVETCRQAQHIFGMQFFKNTNA